MSPPTLGCLNWSMHCGDCDINPYLCVAVYLVYIDQLNCALIVFNCYEVACLAFALNVPFVWFCSKLPTVLLVGPVKKPGFDRFRLIDKLSRDNLSPGNLASGGRFDFAIPVVRCLSVRFQQSCRKREKKLTKVVFKCLDGDSLSPLTLPTLQSCRWAQSWICQECLCCGCPMDGSLF